MINPEVCELCVYVTASECDPCGSCLDLSQKVCRPSPGSEGLDHGYGAGGGCRRRPVAFEHEV